jgi:hypothetical protein
MSWPFGAQHVDGTTQDDDPVVVVIGRREQHLAGVDPATVAELEHGGELVVVELSEGRPLRQWIAHLGDRTGRRC